MRTKNENRIVARLRTITTESLAKWLLWIVSVLIIFFIIAFFVLGPYFGLTLGEEINFLLSSVIAVFAFVEGLSTYLQVRLEKDKNRLQEIKDELEKVYGPLYSIFNKKTEYIQEKEFVFINSDEKSKVDGIIVSFPFLLEPIMLNVWRNFIERLQPYKTEPTVIFAIPMFFVSHITIPYDELTDEYQKRVGKEVTESSFHKRLRRLPPRENEFRE